MPKARVLVAIIAYNEEDSIAACVEDLGLHVPQYDVVVVDNASSDRTVERAEAVGANVISHCVNSGSSTGTETTFVQYAYREGYQVVCQFDGDGQHMAAELPKIVDPILNDEADYVVGSRFIEREGFQSYAVRRIGIRFFSRLTSLLVREPITDITSGFRAYNRGVMRIFAKRYRHEVHDNGQHLLLSHQEGARFREVPIRMREREHGLSEYSFSRCFLFPIRSIISLFGVLIQARPRGGLHRSR